VAPLLFVLASFCIISSSVNCGHVAANQSQTCRWIREYWQKCRCCLKKWSGWNQTNHTGGSALVYRGWGSSLLNLPCQKRGVEALWETYLNHDKFQSSGMVFTAPLCICTALPLLLPSKVRVALTSCITYTRHMEQELFWKYLDDRMLPDLVNVVQVITDILLLFYFSLSSSQ